MLFELVSVAPLGLCLSRNTTHGWRRGLNSCAASRLASVLTFQAVRSESTSALTVLA